MAARIVSPLAETPDIVRILERRTPAERHAMARLLDPYQAIDIFAWIADQPDCDLATAALIVWRLRSVSGRDGEADDFMARNAVLSRVLGKCRNGGYPSCDLAWDGTEAWDRTSLIDAAPLAGVECAAHDIPLTMRGPFGREQAPPVWDALLDEGIEWDDIFDSMWRHHPDDAGVADYLIHQDADVWLAAIDDLVSSHADDLFDWMLRQPECPQSAAERIAHLLGPDWSDRHATAAPTTFGRTTRRSISRPDDFSYYALIRCRGGLLGRPRAAAVAEWREATKPVHALPDIPPPSGRREVPIPERPAGALERFCYGGKFAGTQKQMDRCWRRFVALSVCAAATLLILMRGGAPHVAIWFFFALVVFVSVAQSSWKMGSSTRLVTWWIVVIALALGCAGIFRMLDAT